MKKSLIIILSIFMMSSCGFYSFTGASIPDEAKTISVNYFSNQVTNSPPTLNQKITEDLKDLFLSQTSLDLKSKNGDLQFSGKIIQYEVSPIAIQANETASKNRLTISVDVSYKNSFSSNNNFENTFKRYRDFEGSVNFSEIENDLIEEIVNELCEDIYNKAFVNW